MLEKGQGAVITPSLCWLNPAQQHPSPKRLEDANHALSQPGEVIIRVLRRSSLQLVETPRRHSFPPIRLWLRPVAHPHIAGSGPELVLGTPHPLVSLFPFDPDPGTQSARALPYIQDRQTPRGIASYSPEVQLPLGWS